MKFSTRARYGLRFLIRLAALPPGALLSLSEAAREEGISSGYLEQIARELRRAGILQSERGSGGGYRLARPAAGINLAEVLHALEGDIHPVDCLGGNNQCARAQLCSSRGFWRDLDAHMEGFLKSRFLADLVNGCQHGGDDISSPLDQEGGQL